MLYLVNNYLSHGLYKYTFESIFRSWLVILRIATFIYILLYNVITKVNYINY